MDNAFDALTYGLYIVSSFSGKKKTGHVSNTVFQVTSEPAQITISSNKDNLTTQYILDSKSFSVSVLESDLDLSFFGPWGFSSGLDTDKFKDANYITGQTGSPIVLDKCIAWFDCKLVTHYDVGSHILFVAEVIESRLLKDSSLPLTYDYYRKVIKGVSPKNAPTYKGEKEKPVTNEKATSTTPSDLGPMYQCTVCGLIYDPAEGDPDSGIPPGTPFEDIPDNWECPVCGVTKEDFKIIE